MFNIFRKKEEEISRTNPGFEETERRTPKTGIILLIIMFIAGIWFGWYAVDDIARIPTSPPALSNCAYSYGSVSDSVIFRSYDYSYRSYDYYDYDGSVKKCNFGDLEKAAGIPLIYENKRVPLENDLKKINNELNTVNSSLYNVQDQLRRQTPEYGIGLQEKGAGVQNPIFRIPAQQQQLINLQNQEKDLLSYKVDLEAKKSLLDSKIKAVDEELKVAYKPVFEKQNKLLRWYEFKIFLLQFILIVPFFLLIFWLFLKFQRKNSPYTVIFTAMIGVVSILLLRVILTWFWGLFLARVIEVLIRWFNFGFFRSIVFYLGMILSFAIFGGAVYWLQKKVFDPRRVAIRRFRAKKCPNCDTNLDLSVYYCPNCGQQIKEKCEKCGEVRIIGLPVCPYCGNRK
ncbi:hypothetical protein A2819_02745 [Candidatus Azambacteria bacterium RIFCSPHIGHO2_01_FULL_40_24]|uniref:DZANK-type domain-containing protein n=1 Tax=Candidatus Azambacteria bacterium RIFCSPHIGHO2_01_FULL_40_24 TaxID=1797301 RepID=A0A1F5B2S6_9BACT|nr:MAG: hypothetical protein A2819_02745 [Candidatus Azambacteria bacterium RIFCSPHIGHO2_01_FULL_40_24]